MISPEGDVVYRGLLTGFVATACSLVACTQEQPAAIAAADWVLTNGQIYTVDDARPRAEAMVIRDSKFIYVGDNAGAESFMSKAVRTTDLGGRMVIPGIVDAHTHPGFIELEQYDLTLDSTGRDDFLAQLTSWAEQNPGDGWLRVYCWPNRAFVDGTKGPDRVDLDAIFPERPVWITSCSWHSYWVNSNALSALGIDRETEDPKFPIAMYKRDDDGRLTGWIKEGAGWQHFPAVFEVDEDIHQSAIRAMLTSLSEYGVTALYDGGASYYADDVYAFVSSLEKAGELPLRYEGTYMISKPQLREHAVAEMKRYRQEYGGERLQFNTIKLFMDGIHENRSGAVLEPYADNPDHVSDTLLSVEELRDFLMELHEHRFDLHVHVIGDLAVESVLDAVEQARELTGPEFYPRVSMGHLQTVDPDDWPRFRQLDVSANFTPWWHGLDDPDPIGAGLGAERDNDTFRARALMDRGANVTFSSDTWTLDVLSPFLGMETGHTRQYPRDRLAPGADPNAIRQPASEKMPLEDMLRGYTRNGAYQLRMEDRIGSIQTGKLADFVVLPENLFEMDPYRIHTAKPEAVLMEGRAIQGILD
jgi:predicted amidohydrolase YtcJ